MVYKAVAWLLLLSFYWLPGGFMEEVK